MKKAFWKVASPVLTQIWFGYPFFVLGILIFSAIHDDPSMGTTVGFTGLYTMYFMLPIMTVWLLGLAYVVFFVLAIPARVMRVLVERKKLNEVKS